MNSKTKARSGKKGFDPVKKNLGEAIFYKVGMPASVIVMGASLVVLALCVYLVFAAATKEPETRFVTADDEGRIVPLIALNQPNHSDSGVGDWLTRALVDTYDFHYANINSQLNKATSAYFTDAGRDALLAELERTDTLGAVRRNEMIVSLAVQDTPLVARKGVAPSGRYLWQLEAPVKITYRTATNVFSNDFLFTVTIARTSQTQNKSGLAIQSIVSE